MTEGLKRIEEDFEFFSDAVRKCQSAPTFQRADWQDAYARLARVKGRYLKEKDALAHSERHALVKALEEDTFFEGMLNFRQVGEHVVKRSGAIIRTVDNAPIELDLETSAIAAFGAPQVSLVDTRGDSHRIDHLRQLQEAEKRIQKALRNARS